MPSVNALKRATENPICIQRKIATIERFMGKGADMKEWIKATAHLLLLLLCGCVGGVISWYCISLLELFGMF